MDKQEAINKEALLNKALEPEFTDRGRYETFNGGRAGFYGGPRNG